jgi:hypothetical protein
MELYYIWFERLASLLPYQNKWQQENNFARQMLGSVAKNKIFPTTE